MWSSGAPARGEHSFSWTIEPLLLLVAISVAGSFMIRVIISEQQFVGGGTTPFRSFGNQPAAGQEAAPVSLFLTRPKEDISIKVN